MQFSPRIIASDSKAWIVEWETLESVAVLAFQKSAIASDGYALLLSERHYSSGKAHCILLRQLDRMPNSSLFSIRHCARPRQEQRIARWIVPLWPRRVSDCISIPILGSILAIIVLALIALSWLQSKCLLKLSPKLIIPAEYLIIAFKSTTFLV